MIILNILIFSLGLALLVLAADWLIQASVKFSFILKLSPLFIGLVLVAFGTSLPEAGVGITAAVRNQEGIALGNVLGSNIANIGLVLGLCATFWPVSVGHKRIFSREIPILLASVILLYVLCLDLLISRIDGLLLISCFAIFCFMSYKSTARSSEKKEASDFEFKRHIKDMNSRAKISLIIVFSLIGIFLGADLMVKGGVALARHFGISPWIVGITVFAIGTSLPELATSLTASIKKIPSVGMGNIVGSNIFNVLLVLGTVALIRPVALEASLLRFEFPALLIFTVALIVIMRTQFRVSRLEGLALFLGYVGFIVLLLVRS